MVLLTKTLWRKISVVNGRKRFVTLYLKLLWYRVAFNQDIVKSQGTIFPPFPPPGNPRAFDCRPCMGRWGIWALPSGSGEFELEVSSISSGIQGGGRCRWGEEGLLKLYNNRRINDYKGSSLLQVTLKTPDRRSCRCCSSWLSHTCK